MISEQLLSYLHWFVRELHLPVKEFSSLWREGLVTCLPSNQPIRHWCDQLQREHLDKGRFAMFICSIKAHHGVFRRQSNDQPEEKKIYWSVCPLSDRRQSSFCFSLSKLLRETCMQTENNRCLCAWRAASESCFCMSVGSLPERLSLCHCFVILLWFVVV